MSYLDVLGGRFVFSSFFFFLGFFSPVASEYRLIRMEEGRVVVSFLIPALPFPIIRSSVTYPFSSPSSHCFDIESCFFLFFAFLLSN